MSKKRSKRWSYRAGRHGAAVRVYELPNRPTIYLAVWDPKARDGEGAERRTSLGHSDRRRAMEQADKLVAEIEKLRADPPTVGRVFALYEANKSIDKGAAQQLIDQRQRELWTAVLGADFDLSGLSSAEWDGFRRDRGAGRIDGRGRRATKPVPVGPRTVAKDLAGLRSACRWACTFRLAGRRLLDSDPTTGLALPVEKNPKRVLATHDRVERIREHYHRPRMRVERDGSRERVESHLPQLLEVALGTGRRISAICGLRTEDVELARTEETPHGAIRWAADRDKVGREWWCPISPDTRAAVERALVKRGQVGRGWLFPAARDASKPVRAEQAIRWLHEAERLAGLEPIKGAAFHSYRRLWATSRKFEPDVDVAKAGGWRSVEALQRAYQQPDAATLYRVVMAGVEIREAR